jgi:hypothetical protein
VLTASALTVLYGLAFGAPIVAVSYYIRRKWPTYFAARYRTPRVVVGYVVIASSFGGAAWLATASAPAGARTALGMVLSAAIGDYLFRKLPLRRASSRRHGAATGDHLAESPVREQIRRSF